MRYFSVTHAPLPWSLPDFMEPISTVPAGEGVVNLAEQYPECGGRDSLSEYETLFALRRLLQAEWAGETPPPDEPMIGVSHYRRFAVTRPTGTESENFGIVSPELFVGLPDDLFLPPPDELVLPQPARFTLSVLEQYAGIHVARDLLYFMGLAVDLGVAEGAVVAGFLSGNLLIAAPTIGVYPTEWYIRVLTQLESVADAFESTAWVAREGYQRRVLGFCCERLHSLLTLQLLASWPPDRVIANRALLVSDDVRYRTGGHLQPQTAAQPVA